jgi:hypothetical protein
VRRGQHPASFGDLRDPGRSLEAERGLLGVLPSLRPELGPKPITRKVDKLSCIRFASARYSVPNKLIGSTVTVLVDEHTTVLRVVEPVTGEIHAEHPWSRPGKPLWSTTTTAGRDPISRTAEHAARPRPRRSSFRGAGCRGVPHRSRGGRGDQAARARSPRSSPSRPPTANPRWPRRWNAPSPSAGGAPVTSGRSWPPMAKPPSRPHRDRRWC